MNKRVSFDFDDTLTREDVQEYAKELISKGVEVFVVTKRYDELHKHLWADNPTNDDLWEVTNRLGIPERNVIFTNVQPKSKVLLGSNVLWHLDDTVEVLHDIHRNSETLPVYVENDVWKKICNRLLKDNENE